MRLYEVWTPRGCVSGYSDKGLADKAFRRASSPALLTLGASVLAVREGTTQRQRAAIEEALKAARSGGETIDVPKPDPAAAKVHRLPLVARRPVKVEADDDTTDAGDELDVDDDSDDTTDEELPTADAPRDSSPAVERPAVVAAPAPTTPEVSMAPKSNVQAVQTARPTCAAKGCTNPVPPGISAGRRTVAWRGPYCHRCRDRGRKAIEDGRATAETVGAYLDGRDHRDTTEATKARMVQRAAKKVVKVPRVAPVTAPEQAVELSADNIQVTIALPSDVARAHRCALVVGGVEALERLIAALPAAVRS